MTRPERTVAYTDGACSGNPGPGGWAWLVPSGRYDSGAEAHSTNQRMEITAAWRAVEAIEGPLEIRSDSTYVVNCFRDRWWEGWLARDWHNSARKPVANRDLWEPFVNLVRSRGDVVFSWVKGHSGDPWNDKVDRLAVAAMRNQAPSGGGVLPEELGPSDAPSGAATLTNPLPGHAVVILGHQPPQLGGYEPNPVAARVQQRLEEILRAKATLREKAGGGEPLVVVSGLRLGAEHLGAEAALAVGLPLVAVLPYPDPDARWSAASRRRFAELCREALEVIVLQPKAPKSTAQAAMAMSRRDAWLARHGAEAILVWDGRDQRLAKLHKSLSDQLAEDVWVIDPTELS